MVQKTDKSSRFVMDENTLTFESINLGYEFPLNIAKKFGMQALSVQANMNDIFRWSTVKAERGIIQSHLALIQLQILQKIKLLLISTSLLCR